MFTLLGIWELVQHSYAETDAFFSRAQVQKGGRLVNYLKLLTVVKRGGSGPMTTGGGYVSSGGGGNQTKDFSAVKIWDKTDLQKLKGVKVDDKLIELIYT